MGRPSGWDVVDQGDDPVKGDPSTLRMMSREYQRISDAAEDASTRLQSVKGSGWLTDWEGEAADVFVDAIEDTPSDLTKLVDSYELAATALSGWADTVDDTQYRADGALADAKDATGDLAAAQDRLADAQSNLSHYQSTSSDLSKVADEYPAGSEVPDGVDVPSPAQLRAASDNASVAQGSVSSAQGDIAAAQSRIDAAKRLVADAKGDWQDAEQRTATKIGEAADAGLGKQSTWDKIFGSEAWETIVSIAKVVVAVGGIIVMIIGGPLAWIVLGAALLVLADTLYKMSKGTADGWDLAFALLDCIPGMKGITTAGRLLSAAGDARTAFSLARSTGSLGSLAARTLSGAGRYGVMALKELPLAVKQFASNPARRLERMALQVRYLTPANMLHSTVDAAKGFASGYTAGGRGTGITGRLLEGIQKSDSAFTRTVNSGYNAHVSEIARTDPARASQLWQGGDGYYGVDDMTNVVAGSKGVDGFASTPNFDGFGASYAVPDRPVVDSATFHESAQVGASTGYATPYREFVSETHISPDATYAIGHAGANPQFGGGGGTQMFRADMTGHNPAPFPAHGGSAHAWSPMDSSVRTVGESVAMRNLLHAPWRATAYTAPLASSE
jgi:uncharacterized protein YukE